MPLTQQENLLFPILSGFRFRLLGLCRSGAWLTSCSFICQAAALPSMLLSITGVLSTRHEFHAMPGTSAYQLIPDQRPCKQHCPRYYRRKKPSRLGEGTGKAERTHGSVFQVTGREHCGANQTQGDHMHKDFLVKCDEELFTSCPRIMGIDCWIGGNQNPGRRSLKSGRVPGG